MMYLAFDPGETTGVCEFWENGNMANKHQFDFNDLVTFLFTYKEPVAAVICEDFKIRGGKAKSFTGNRMEVVQAIGAIRSFAVSKKCKYILQDASIKPMAQRQTQVFPKGAHADTHWVDAFNHGAFYLIRQGIRKTFLQQEYEDGKL